MYELLSYDFHLQREIEKTADIYLKVSIFHHNYSYMTCHWFCITIFQHLDFKIYDILYTLDL